MDHGAIIDNDCLESYDWVSSKVGNETNVRRTKKRLAIIAFHFSEKKKGNAKNCERNGRKKSTYSVFSDL